MDIKQEQTLFNVTWDSNAYKRGKKFGKPPKKKANFVTKKQGRMTHHGPCIAGSAAGKKKREICSEDEDRDAKILAFFFDADFFELDLSKTASILSKILLIRM